MEKKLSEKFLEEMAKTVLPVLIENGIDEELHYTITTDIVFQLANLFDEGGITYKGRYFPKVEFKGKKKTFHAIDGLHELVYGVLGVDDFEELYPVEKDYCICFLKMIREKGIKYEMSILKSVIDTKEQFIAGLELALEVRDIDEIDKPLNIQRRLKEKERKYGKIVSLEYQFSDDFFNDKWESYKHSGGDSIEALMINITETINRYNKCN